MSFTAERVQLTGKLTANQQYPPPNYDEYWKLEKHWPRNTEAMKSLLEQRGYAAGATMNNDWLRESLIRSDLGQISYVSCSNAQLREFIVARGIDVKEVITKRSKGFRKELIQLLDKADQNPRFLDFIVLPAEIRNRVYSMYFDEFPKPLDTPIQPPLTFTGSQVRKETLQMFYSSCQFEIAVIQRRGYNFVRSVGINRLRLSPNLLHWFHSLSKQSLLSLRRLRFDVHSHDGRQYVGSWRHDQTFSYGYLGWFELEVMRAGDREQLQLFFPEGPSQYVVARLFKVRRAIRRVVAKINARKGKLCLMVDDLKALRKALEA